MSESALPTLLQARKTVKSLEHARRLDDVIAMMQARHERPGSQSMSEFRALEVLERIGTSEARKHVADVAAGADSVVTYEAQAILAR